MNLSHIPALQFRLRLIAPRIRKLFRTLLRQILGCDRMVVVVSAVAPVAASGTSRGRRSAPFESPRKVEEAAGTKLKVAVKPPSKTISAIAPPARVAFSDEKGPIFGGGWVGSWGRYSSRKLLSFLKGADRPALRRLLLLFLGRLDVWSLCGGGVAALRVES